MVGCAGTGSDYASPSDRKPRIQSMIGDPFKPLVKTYIIVGC